MANDDHSTYEVPKLRDQSPGMYAKKTRGGANDVFMKNPARIGATKNSGESPDPYFSREFNAEKDFQTLLAAIEIWAKQSPARCYNRCWQEQDGQKGIRQRSRRALRLCSSDDFSTVWAEGGLKAVSLTLRSRNTKTLGFGNSRMGRKSGLAVLTIGREPKRS